MESVRIEIDTATSEALAAECARLGIRVKFTRGRASDKTMRNQLKRYRSDCKLYRQWLKLLAMLPGGEQVEPPEGIEALMDAVCDLLMAMLVRDGYVGEPAKTKAPIFDFANARDFYILSPQNTRVVNTTAGGYSVLHAAQCAFDRVRFIFEEWERWRKTEAGP